MLVLSSESVAGHFKQGDGTLITQNLWRSTLIGDVPSKDAARGNHFLHLHSTYLRLKSRYNVPRPPLSLTHLLANHTPLHSARLQCHSSISPKTQNISFTCGGLYRPTWKNDAILFWEPGSAAKLASTRKNASRTSIAHWAKRWQTYRHHRLPATVPSRSQPDFYNITQAVSAWQSWVLLVIFGRTRRHFFATRSFARNPGRCGMQQRLIRHGSNPRPNKIRMWHTQTNFLNPPKPKTNWCHETTIVYETRDAFRNDPMIAHALFWTLCASVNKYSTHTHICARIRQLLGKWSTLANSFPCSRDDDRTQKSPLHASRVNVAVVCCRKCGVGPSSFFSELACWERVKTKFTMAVNKFWVGQELHN